MSRNILAREKALFPGHPAAAVAATTPGDRRRSLQADRGRLRSSALRDRDRRRARTGRADPARDVARRRQAVERDRARSSSSSEMSRKGLLKAEVIIERNFTTRLGPSGIHRAQCPPRERGGRRQDDDLELEPGPVHGPGDDIDGGRTSAERRARHSRRNRRWLRREDRRSSRAAGGGPVEKSGRPVRRWS